MSEAKRNELDAPGCSAWYRKRAEEVRYNGKTVTQYNHFLGIAEAIERKNMEAKELRDTLEWLVDLQNGCPLEKYRKDWSRTMEQARCLLGRSND